DTLGLVPTAELDHTALPGLDVRAVVTPEHDEHQLALGKVREPVRLSVDPGQSEVGSRVPGVQVEIRQFGHDRTSDGVLLALEVPSESGGKTISGGHGAMRHPPAGVGFTTWVGVGVPPDAAYLQRAAGARIPAVRRTTGGSGLLHAPGDLAWSIVLPRADPRVGKDYVHAYPRLGAGVVDFLSERGVAAKWVDPPGTDPDYCLLSARGSVLALEGKVLGGAAQHLAGGALLHH